jgi:ribosome-associated translation inhibitor RaiA
MLIQIRTDGNIKGNDALTGEIEEIVSNNLRRFSAKITRLSVHLSDQNSESKFGTADMRCQMEARVAGLQPVSVSDDAETMEQAANGAARKLKRALENTLGRLDSR